MKIIIPGGSGQVGTILARHFHTAGDEVVILSRAPRELPWKALPWDGKTLAGWAKEFEGANAVINLAGRNVNCRYKERNRREILESRVNSVRAVGQAIENCSSPPPVWLQASTATIYAHRFDAPNDEFTGIIGGNEPEAPDSWKFSIEVAKAWEQAVDEAHAPRTRKVKMRSAMIMSPDPGGIFATLLMLVRLGIGGKAGSGRQFISWVHYQDFVRAVRWIIRNERLEGVINIASPNPIPQVEFMHHLRSAWGMPIGLPATKWMLEIGAFFIRTETELILKSRRVIPGRLSQDGFQFEYPAWPGAARDLCAAWRAR
jgi:uncharacterized protein (TIGR01777 family)